MPMNVDEIVERSKWAKKAHISGGYPTDVLQEATLERGDVTFRLFTLPTDAYSHSKEQFFDVMTVAIRGLRPDRFCTINDGYSQNDQLPEGTTIPPDLSHRNAHTFGPLRAALASSRHRGSMASAWAAGEAAKYHISEAMTAVLVERNDTEALCSMTQIMVPYVHEGNELTWHKKMSGLIDDPERSGFFPEALLHAMTQPDAQESIESMIESCGANVEDFGDEVKRRIMTDVVCGKELTESYGAAFIIETTDPELTERYEACAKKLNLELADLEPNRAERRRRQREQRRRS